MDATNPYRDVPLQPKPGDYSICDNCGTALRFTENMALTELTPEFESTMSWMDLWVLKGLRTVVAKELAKDPNRRVREEILKEIKGG